MITKELLSQILAKPEIETITLESTNLKFNGLEVGLLPKTIGTDAAMEDVLLALQSVSEDDDAERVKAYRNYNITAFVNHVCDADGNLLFDKDTALQVPKDVILFVVSSLNKINGKVTDEELDKQAKK